MIKLIVFDLVGVLVKESDIELNEIEDKLERLFGPNLNDEDYLEKTKFITTENIIEITKRIINNLYEERCPNLISDLKKELKDIKIVIATNHVSYVRKYIEKTFPSVDDIIISAEINRIKPNIDFYEYILGKYKINSKEMLFLDDNKENIESAKMIGINTILVQKDTNILTEIKKRIIC